MAVDPKLRELLDSLDEAPARSRPADDREMLLSVLERLKIRESRRTRPRAMPRPSQSTGLQSELEAARDEARRRQDELDRIVAERQQSDEALRAANAERDELIRRQEELEARLAELETSSHGGHLSFVEEDDEPVEAPSPVVEFSRVDLATLGGDDDLMEFESVGSRTTSAFDSADHGAWDDQAVAWSDDEAGVAWDEDDEWSASGSDDAWETGTATTEPDWSDESSWEQAHDDPDPYGAPAETDDESAWADVAPAPAESWEQAHDDPAPWTEDTSAAPTEPAWEAPPETPEADQLDERTQRDLNELERQLRDLENELAKRQAVTGKRTDPDRET